MLSHWWAKTLTDYLLLDNSRKLLKQLPTHPRFASPSYLIMLFWKDHSCYVIMSATSCKPEIAEDISQSLKYAMEYVTECFKSKISTALDGSPTFKNLQICLSTWKLSAVIMAYKLFSLSCLLILELCCNVKLHNVHWSKSQLKFVCREH